jgi:hypothetical protein
LRQAILSGLGCPLLSHSVHVPAVEMRDGEYAVSCVVEQKLPAAGLLFQIATESRWLSQVPDAGSLLDLYGNRGLDFIVDVGTRTVQPTSVSCTRAAQQRRYGVLVAAPPGIAEEWPAAAPCLMLHLLHLLHLLPMHLLANALTVRSST